MTTYRAEILFRDEDGRLQVFEYRKVVETKLTFSRVLFSAWVALYDQHPGLEHKQVTSITITHHV